MNLDWGLVTELGWPIVLIFVGALLNHLLERRERLIAYLGHVSSFRLEPENAGEAPRWVYTHSVIVRNNGRKTATNVRLGHAILPNVTVYPDIEYHIRDLPSGGRELVVPHLVPKKELTISYLYFPPVTWNQINTHLESDNGPIKVVRVMPQVQAPRWLLGILWALIIADLIATLYVLVGLLRAIATNKRLECARYARRTGSPLRGSPAAQPSR